MKAQLLFITMFFCSCTFWSQSNIEELYPTRTSSVSYAVQTNNNLDYYSEIRNSDYNYGPFIPGFNAGFYLSVDTTISPSDILVADYPVPCMNSQSCNTSSNGWEWLKPISATNIDLTLQSIPTGTYYVGVYLDRQNVIIEFTKANNGWAFRNGNVFTTVNYPVLDVGISKNDLQKDLVKYDRGNGLVLKSRTGREIGVEVFSLDGRLLLNERSAEVSVPKQHTGIYILKVSSATVSYCEKLIF